jgi:hypothetical protein
LNDELDNDDTDSQIRPNAKYGLSKADNSGNSQEGLIFHYNRERRLENAPTAVQNLYKEQKQSRFGFFGVLVADKPRRVLLFVIILLCVGIIALLNFGFLDNNRLDGNTIEVTGIHFEGNTIITLGKLSRGADAYTGAVNIAVSVPVQPEEVNPVFYHLIFFTLENEEIYRFSVPFDAPELLMVLQTERDTLQLRIRPR